MHWRLTLLIIVLLSVSTHIRGQTTKTEKASTPAAVKEILKQLNDEITDLQKEAEKKINARKRNIARQLMIVQDKYCKEGRLDEAIKIRDYIRQMLTQAKGGIKPDPGYFNGEPNAKPGDVFLYKVKGVITGGTIYGSDIYTTGSHLGMAAVHCGALKRGETGIVKVTQLGRQTKYASTTRHGITSSGYGPWSVSFKVERAILETKVTNEVLEDPGTLHAFRGKIGITLKFEVTGSSKGTVWGTDIYTDDSNLATAAVHAGILKEGEKGTVLVTILEGKSRYKSSLQHGVTSKQWDGWVGSYRVSKAKNVAKE